MYTNAANTTDIRLRVGAKVRVKIGIRFKMKRYMQT
jgi:hypothetical protein